MCIWLPTYGEGSEAAWGKEGFFSSFILFPIQKNLLLLLDHFGFKFWLGH